jgi:hypothetical protein
MRGLHIVAWTRSLMIAGRSQSWPLAGDARYGDLGTRYTVPVSLALKAEQRVADGDVLKADDGSYEEANSMAFSASRDARLMHIVIVHTGCPYWDYSDISHQPGRWLQASTGDCTYLTV